MVEALACYHKGSWLEPSKRLGFSSFSFFYSAFLNVQTDFCKLKITEFMITRLFENLFNAKPILEVLHAV